MATKRFCDKCGREMPGSTGFLFKVSIDRVTEVKMAVSPTSGGDVCPRCVSDAVLKFVDTNYPPLTRRVSKGQKPVKSER